MKFFLCVLLSVVASSHALVDPAILFSAASTYQGLVTTLQQDIVTKITTMRFSMSAILKSTSNQTLDQIQDNLATIFEMETPARTELFEGNPTMDDCMISLRNQLNSVTEMSGYNSGNCIARYNRSMAALVADAYVILETYEDLITVIQMTVLNAFSGMNIWTKSVEIVNDFTAVYDEQFARWQQIQVEITDFLATMESDILAFNVVLGTCFTNIQNGLQPRYNDLINQVDICREFYQ